MNSDETQHQNVPEAVVVKFSQLELDMPYFLEDYPGSVSIPTITDGWEKPIDYGVFTRMQFALNLS